MYLNDIFTVPASLAGIPGISIPFGNNKNNLPLGVQLLSKQFNEQIILDAGLYLEKNNTGGHQLGFNLLQTDNSIEVPVTKINLDKINFAKIDVEGSELHVLEGMKVLPEKLLIEFAPRKLQNNGTKLEDFFKFIQKFSVKEVSKNGLIEADFDNQTIEKSLFLY